MMVYNTNPDVTQEGLYVWNGNQWVYIASPSVLPVTTVQVKVEGTPSADSYIASDSPSAADTIFWGKTIPLRVELTPATASVDHFAWSVSGFGASITGEGEFTAVRTGTFTVRATSPIGAFGEKHFVVVNSRVQDELTFPSGNKYLTMNYNGIEWMVENLKEGEDGEDGILTTYNGSGTLDETIGYSPSEGERGYYYSLGKARTMCPEGWSLPNHSEALTMFRNIEENWFEATVQTYWTSSSNFAGRMLLGAWVGWGDFGQLWVDIPGSTQLVLQLNNSTPIWTKGSESGERHSSVRCVRRL
jgi:uncharacterized protein (TIGR02145 family)